MRFGDLPLVLKTIAMSPGAAEQAELVDEDAREIESLPIAVIVAISVISGIAGNARRFSMIG